MHTTGVKGITFIHNGDFSGYVIIVLPKGSVQKLTGPDSSKVHVQVPFEAIKGLVAEFVRQEKERALEDAEDDELLGIPQKI